MAIQLLNSQSTLFGIYSGTRDTEDWINRAAAFIYLACQCSSLFD